MGGSLSTADARTHEEAGVRLQIRQTILVTTITFHALLAWYLVIQTLVKGNCIPDIPSGEVAVPHAVWNLVLLPVTYFGLLATRHEIEPDPNDFTMAIRLFYVVLALCMIGNAVATGFFSWELWRCATDYCLEKKGFLIGGNVVLHAVALLLEGFLVAMTYLYARDLRIAITRKWQPQWKVRKLPPPKAVISRWQENDQHTIHHRGKHQ